MKGLRLVVGSIVLLMLPALCQAGLRSSLNGLGSFGISIGVMQWLADDDVREIEQGSAQIRPIGKAVFRYRINSTWLVSVETGFGWNGYPDSGDMTTLVIPITVGLERRVGELWGATTSACFGGGLYIWGRKQDGEYLRDPETSESLHAADPGAYVGAASEFHLSDHVTFATHLTANYILSTHGDNYPTLMGDDDLFVDLRLGVHYYFSPYEGLVWGSDEEE